MSQTDPSTKPLWLAGLAAIGASVCCVGPLLLLTLGIGGTWVSTLTAMEPARPVFIIATLVILGWIFRQLYLVPANCKDEEICANPAVLRNQRIIYWIVTLALITLLAFPYYATLIIA
ncbi:MAG: mercuric transporter MerT family protein [Gammaproteobacteria bacterium]